MTDFLILKDLGTIVFAALGALLLARRLRAPSIIAYILAGVAIGPVAQLVSVSESVELISESGIALLLFLVGLELSLDRIRVVGRVAVVGGILQVVFTLAAGFGVSLLVGLRGPEAALLALAMSVSSTVVVVKLLTQRSEMGSRHGRIAIGILLVQDVVIALALTTLAGLSSQGSLDVASVARGVIYALLGMAGLTTVALLATRYVLPHVFRWAATMEAQFIWSLSWCFLFIVAAEAMHLSVEIGAFVAGVSLAQLDISAQLERRVHPLVNFFLAVFFVALGIQLDLSDAGSAVVPALVLTAFVLLGKPLLLWLILPRLGVGARASVLTGITLGQMSEFSFVLAAMASAAGFIGDELLSLLSVVALLTIGVSAIAIAGLDGLWRFLSAHGLPALLRAHGKDGGTADPPRRDHVVVVGMNTMGESIVRRLVAQGAAVLAIDTDPSKLRGLPCPRLVGNTDDHDVLERADYRTARLVVSALQIEDANNLIAYRCRAANVPCSVHAFDPALASELLEIGADHVMVSKHDGIRQVAAALRAEGVLD